MGRDNDQDTINAHELHEHSVGRSSASKYPRKIAELSRVPEAAGGVRNAPFGELLGDVGVHKQVLHRLNEVKPYDSVSSSSGTPFSLRAHTITTSHTTAATSVSAQSRRKNYPPNRKPPSNSNGLPDSANIPSADARIPCNECPMTLANPRSLRSHMNTVHQERVRVRCNYEGCLVYYEEGERKAKSNIFEKHQKVKHAAWVEGLTVEQRCTVFVRQNPSPGSLDTRLWKRQSGNESRNEGRIPITDEQHVYIAS
ncbi:uncharacterized protein DFL_000090 [Arthrobotrys flagrans]|uniref:C2H2-type domain-containing protein n=1 Tax=Arthrobotrys flagrans TaxID=97331 RepID=A0A437AD76_ARTFL|nr:hypothetical protein DFL_000090 [Arthrobotrys flagrans]